MAITHTINKALHNIREILPSIRRDNTRYNTWTTSTYHHPITNQTNLRLYYAARTNPVVYRCNKVFKNTALACDFSIDTDTREDDSLPTSEYLDRLFHQPEGYQTQATWASMNSLIWDSTADMGDCFFEISTDDNYNVLNGFKYIHNSQICWDTENDCYSLTEQPEIKYEPDELIHIREPDITLEDSPWGISKINRAANYIALFENAIRYNNDILGNDGLDPNLIISFNDNVNSRNMQSELDRLYNDKQNRRRRILALKGATVQHSGYNTKDMSYLSLINYAEDGIVRTFGVPPQLYGKIETANLGSGSGDSQKKDWKITFDGEKCFVEDAFNNCLKSHGFSERFHYQAMDIIDELYDAQVAQIYVASGIKTRDEIRNELGLDRLNDTWSSYYGY